MFFSLTPHFFSPYSTFIRIRWLKYWALVSGQGRRDASEWGKVSWERERPTQPSPCLILPEALKGPRTFYFLPVGFVRRRRDTSDNQHPSQKRLISHRQSLNRRILSVISPEWLLWPWWIFKPFLLRAQDIFLTLSRYPPVMDLERFLKRGLLASLLPNNKCSKCIKVTRALVLRAWTSIGMPVYWC